MFIMILGWLCLFGMLIMLTGTVALVSMNLLGTYSIGGVPNGVFDRIIALALLTFIGFCWYGAITHLPFTILFNT